MRRITLDIETMGPASGIMDPATMELTLVGIHDSATDAYSSYVKEELSHLWPVLESADLLIGYNSDHFDIPILNKYYAGDLTKIKSVDLLAAIKDSLGRRLKLDSVAKATLGRGKSGHGLDAIKWWAAGEIEKVRTYCLDDVKLTKEVYEFALKNGFLYYDDFGEKRKIPLDTSAWESSPRTSLTHTLPF
jgi:DEAD/DEAH box helicase domain-containing protein